METAPAKQRLDKWLWQARFFKTRGLAAREVSAGHLRVNAEKVSKPSQQVKIGDTLTFTQGTRVRIVEISGLSERRGPAPEAQLLYNEHSPAPMAKAPRLEDRVGGRPTGKDRRKTDALRLPPLE